jgi:integrase
MLRGQVLAGRDPWAERRATRADTIAAERQARVKSEEAALTVERLIDLYEEMHVRQLRAATQRDVLSRLRLHLSPIASKPAVGIGRRDAALGVDKATVAGDTTARRVRDYARAMWQWAQRRGTLPETSANPWINAPAPGRDVPRDRVLTDDEVTAVWTGAGRLPSPYGPMVRFLILTLARREEVAAMTWGEIAIDLSTWTQPASRTKNGKAHIVHLSTPARRVLLDLLGADAGSPPPKLPSADTLVFPVLGGKAITSHSWVKRHLDAAAETARRETREGAADVDLPPIPHWVLHDFRRTGVTWLAGAGFPPHVADRLLNHIQGTIRGVAAVYQRGEFMNERKKALDAWAVHVSTPSATSNVVPIRARSQNAE